jgi:hypothetical protein
MTNGSSEGCRHLSEIREMDGNGWKVLGRRTNQEQPMGFKHKEGNCHNICAEGSCIRKKVLELPLLGNYL